jgi:hypothetical protein
MNGMEFRRKISYCKLGALSAILAGFFYLIIAVLTFKLPDYMVSNQISDQFFNNFDTFELLFINLKMVTVLANIAMIGVVCAFLALCRPENIALVLWSSILAYLGYGFGIFQSIMDLSVIPELTKKYLHEPGFIQDIIVTVGISNPKMFILVSGLPGIWFLVVSYLAFSNKNIPNFLIYCGFIWGLGNILTALGYAFSIVQILYVVSIVIILVAPIWGLSEGFYLLSLIKTLEKQAKAQERIEAQEKLEETQKLNEEKNNQRSKDSVTKVQQTPVQEVQKQPVQNQVQQSSSHTQQSSAQETQRPASQSMTQQTQRPAPQSMTQQSHQSQSQQPEGHSQNHQRAQNIRQAEQGASVHSNHSLKQIQQTQHTQQNSIPAQNHSSQSMTPPSNHAQQQHPIQNQMVSEQPTQPLSSHPSSHETHPKQHSEGTINPDYHQLTDDSEQTH